MFNWKKVSLILLASAALLSGCTKSNIVSPDSEDRRRWKAGYRDQ